MSMLTRQLMPLTLLVFTVLMLLSSNMAEAFTKNSLSYTINRVWFDSNHIYIVYEKKRVTTRYSTMDIHGTVLEEKSAVFISRLPRETSEGLRVFDLESLEDATSIIYRDKEFDIASVGDGVRLSADKKSVTLPNCKESIWFPQYGGRQDVIRVRNRLLFCGMLFNASGDFVLEIPKSVTNAIERDYQDHPSPFYPLKIISAISNNNFLIMRADLGGPVKELKIGIWSLNADKEMRWEKLVLPPSSKGYEVDTYRAYSPASFVLRPVAAGDKSILICNEARCERLSLHDRYSVVIIDEGQRKLIEITSGTMTGAPSVTVYTSNY